MKQNLNESRAVHYARLFDYPLTPAEAKLWAIRISREEYSRHKKNLAAPIARRLAVIPTVAAIFLTGSVAAGNAKADADLDFMIVTYPHTLWLTRLLVFLFLKITSQLKTPVCPNIFLDIKHLKIVNQNLYTAHEVLQAQCLFDRKNINFLWLKNNSWTKKYLPNAYKFKINQSKVNNKSNGQYPKFQFPVSNFQFGHWLIGIYWVIGNWMIGLIDLCAFVLQYLYMKPKMTNERVGLGFAFFHPRDLSAEVLARFNSRPKKV